MVIRAADAVEGEVYRATRSKFFRRSYYVRHSKPLSVTVRRWQKRRNRLTGREAGLLALALAHPDWPLFWWYSRGKDAWGKRWEVRRLIVLPPGTKLRAVKTKPDYG